MESVQEIFTSIGEILGVDKDLLMMALVAVVGLTVVGVILLLVRGKTSGAGKIKIQREMDQAAKLAGKGNMEAAGDKYFMLQKWDHAAAIYAKGGKWAKGVEAARRGARQDVLVHVLEGAGLFSEAADVLEKQRKYEAAARLLTKGKLYARAGEMWERTGNSANAAKAYYAGQEWEKAARASAKNNDYGSAEKILLHGLDEARKSGGKTKGFAILASDAMLKTGKRDRAIKLLLQEGIDSEVERIAVAAKLEGSIAEMAVKAGRSELAAKLSERSGDENMALKMKAEALKEEDPFGAAELFAQAKDYRHSALLFRKMGHHAEAAAMFEKGNILNEAAADFRKAKDRHGLARVLERLGEFSEAAEAYGRTGNMKKAQELFAKAGKFLSAARVAQRLKKQEDVLKLISKIGSEDVDYGPACLLKGQVLAGAGKRAEALQPLQVGLKSAQVAPENISSWYLLGTILQEQQQPKEALAIYQRIVAADAKYIDIEKRMAEVHQASQVAVETASVQTAPERIGPARYQMLSEIGRGGMGIVYKSLDTQLDRIVAYKVLPEEFRNHKKALDNFKREARSAASLTHPNIVIVHDVGEDAGTAFMVMEFLEGIDCKTMLRQKGMLTPEEAIRICMQVAEGLQYAHDKKIVHRDIKPSNLMMVAGGKVKIMDFGLAKVIREVVNIQTMVGGTPFYMSPEQVKGGAVDNRADLYSLGVSLFEMVTGEVPYHTGEIGYLHVHADIPGIRDLKPKLPEELERIILKLMAKSPDDRFQQAHEMNDALEKLI